MLHHLRHRFSEDLGYGYAGADHSCGWALNEIARPSVPSLAKTIRVSV